VPNARPVPTAAGISVDQQPESRRGYPAIDPLGDSRLRRDKRVVAEGAFVAFDEEVLSWSVEPVERRPGSWVLKYQVYLARDV